MSPRKRVIADSDVVAAAARTAVKHGAEQVRLADVAAESGLAAATLVQRFGSRDGLLDAIGAYFAAEVRAAFAIRASSELERLRVALARLALPDHLRFFIARPGHAAGYSLELRKQIAFVLIAAVEAGELAPCEIAESARAIQLSWYGAATAALLEGVPLDAATVATLIATQLDPYL